MKTLTIYTQSRDEEQWHTLSLLFLEEITTLQNIQYSGHRQGEKNQIIYQERVQNKRLKIETDQPTAIVNVQ